MGFLLVAGCLIVVGFLVLIGHAVQIYLQAPQAEKIGWPKVIEYYLTLQNPSAGAEMTVGVAAIGLAIVLVLLWLFFSERGELWQMIKASLGGVSALQWIGIGVLIGAYPLARVIVKIAGGGVDAYQYPPDMTLVLAGNLCLVSMFFFSLDSYLNKRKEGGDKRSSSSNEFRDVSGVNSLSSRPMVKCGNCKRDFTLVDGASLEAAYCIYCEYVGPVQRIAHR